MRHSCYLTLFLSLNFLICTCAVDTPRELVPLPIDFPKASFTGTPKDIKTKNLEAPRVGARQDMMVPKGCTNLAANQPVISSDSEPVIGELPMITDGDKDASSGSFVELGLSKQWVQIDLGAPAMIAAIALWHYHSEPRVYHAVVVQVADDNAFTLNVRTVFNNDNDNLLGLGAGKDQEYIDTHEGKICDAKCITGRYVRCYSQGNSTNELNHYVEVEVWGIK